jgi:3-hydroxy-9,10-secoandrosta-1,3,5(10)-triene-9,17-dione monooxygenase reductase component
MTINLLADGQEGLSRLFASKQADKFAGIPNREGAFGSPLLADALAYLECEVTTVHPAGDHDILVATVRRAETSGSGEPLVHFKGRYTTVETERDDGAGGLELLRHVQTINA